MKNWEDEVSPWICYGHSFSLVIFLKNVGYMKILYEQNLDAAPSENIIILAWIFLSHILSEPIESAISRS